MLLIPATTPGQTLRELSDNIPFPIPVIRAVRCHKLRSFPENLQ